MTKVDDVPHFTLLGRQALAVMKRLTKHRERKHRERHHDGKRDAHHDDAKERGGSRLLNEFENPIDDHLTPPI